MPTKNKDNRYRKTISLSLRDLIQLQAHQGRTFCVTWPNLAKEYTLNQGVHFSQKIKSHLRVAKGTHSAQLFEEGTHFHSATIRIAPVASSNFPVKLSRCPTLCGIPVLKISKVEATVCIRFREKYSAAMYLGKGKNKEFTKR